MNTSTDYSKKIELLNELWVEYAQDPALQDLFDKYDVGFPLAHAIFESIVQSTPLAQEYIEAAFHALLVVFGLEDLGFEKLEEIISVSEEPQTEPDDN